MLQKLLINFITVYTILFVILILFVNPVFPGGYFITGRSLLAIVLSPWWLIAPYLAIKINLNSRKNWFFLIGIALCYFYLLLSMVLGRSSDVLALSYTLSFISIVALFGNIYLSYKTITSLSLMVDIFSFCLILYSFSTAFGLIAYPFRYQYDINVGESRFTFDTTVGSIAFIIIWLFFRLLNSKKYSRINLYFLFIFLGILRILASGTRGILAGTLISLLYMFFTNFSTIVNFKNTFLFVFTAVGVSIIFNLFDFDIVGNISRNIDSYTEIIRNRDNSTGISRFSEAIVDFETFEGNIFLGAGMDGASLKLDSMYEASAGHFFITGTLARFGLLGLVGFLMTYVYLFKSLLREFSINFLDKRIIPFYILFFFFCIFGNPLYLYPQWPAIAFLLYLFAYLNQRR